MTPNDIPDIALKDFVQKILQENEHLAAQVTSLQEEHTKKLFAIRALEAAAKQSTREVTALSRSIDASLDAQKHEIEKRLSSLLGFVAVREMQYLYASIETLVIRSRTTIGKEAP